MKETKMLVFDVDGTLYDPQHHEIPSSAIKAIHEAKEKGILFVIATGRAHYGLGKALNDLKPDYILADNGAVVVDHNGNIISHHDFSKEDTQRIIDFTNQFEAGLIWKFLDHMYIYSHPEKVDWLMGQINSDIGREPFIFNPQQDRHFLDLPQSCNLHAIPEDVERELIPHTDLDFLPFSEQGYDVVVKGINKGVGLNDLLTFLKIDPEEVMCFGDNHNDMEMMELVGKAVAMGNAIDKIKEIADYVTKPVDQDGIYHALQHFKIID